MMVSNTGNVGIAKTDPQFRLDLNGNMVLRNAGNNITAGIWLASNAGGLDPFFMGLQTDESFGFYWNPAPGGWRFSINPYYGSIMLNGSSGADGALLSSGGGAAAANWQLRSNRDFYALTREAQETTVYNLTDASPTANPTGLSVTQNYPEACKVEVLFNIQALGVACALCGITDFVVSVKLDGTVVKSFRYNAENGLVNTFNGANLLSVTAGNHTINLQIQKLSGPTLQLSNDASRFSNMNLVTTPTN
jgi:hypothetical protein